MNIKKKNCKFVKKMNNVDRDFLIAGITPGDLNGIGYELIYKAFKNTQLFDICTPIVLGNPRAAAYHRKMINNCNVNLFLLKNLKNLKPGKPYIYPVSSIEYKIEIGKITKVGAEASIESLEQGIKWFNEGKIDFLVTCPINKKALSLIDFPFKGHTEFLADAFNIQEYLMMFINPYLKIGLVTTHAPISELKNILNAHLILSKIKVLDNSLQRDFGFIKPKIAVLGLNPHASDEGLIGNEENDVIIPAIREANEIGIEAYGPFPADSFFGNLRYKDFDAVLSMYHDQGLIPFKLLDNQEAVNFTAGLPIVRTSPVHGTAFDIAGKDKANERSFVQAILLGAEITLRRRYYDENIKAQLKDETVSSN